jgi:hypothetical protein
MEDCLSLTFELDKEKIMETKNIVESAGPSGRH